MKKVYVHLPDREGQGLHRAILPVKHCHRELANEGIELVASDGLANLDYDAFIFHRLLKPYFQPVIQQIKDQGKKFIWELDDDLWHIPKWNPASKGYDEEAVQRLDWLRDVADQIIASTEPLAQVVNRPGKTVVLPNLVDTSLWPTLPERKPNDPVRILWAGSVNHERDLDEVVPAVERIIADYGERVMFLFWGDLPDKLAEFVRIRYSHLGMMVPAAKYRGSLGLVQSVPTQQYPETSLALQPDIGIAPLCNDPFNASKSNLKYLDYAMMDAAFVGTKLPPYQDVHHGCLIEPGDGETWYRVIREWIEEPESRQFTARMAHEDVLKTWTWQGPQRQRWLDFFRKVAR